MSKLKIFYMKISYFFITIVVVFSFTGNAQMQKQDSIFMANVWHLQKIEINNSIIPAPNNSELSFPKLTPYIYNDKFSFTKEHCYPGLGQGDFIFKSESTIFINNYAVTSWLCKSNSNEDFMTQNYDNNIIWNNMGSDFQYIISDHASYLQLVITGNNGNKAFYHSNLSASFEDIIKTKVKVYPNPIYDNLYISADDSIIDDIKEIYIYDLSGKLVFRNNGNSKKGINISELSAGSYFLSFLYKDAIIKYGIILKK